ncbi:hypothetical protein CfE428DRAFT_3979 [Chthoniobacter flavus Ellin428]|uniref:Uncharacterized protein n=1 Tax=Chthoniobacter flavus Ellin428 TaxID=497964 RepID=B4D4Z1_9BACT|nr:hypothetical protein CfE428DRAFT_3979 [Chthoniobacter flavus Ellin428]TCO90950.1 hypothetical protein EV701_109100 [Chthoniobacter flavus]
MRKLVPLNLPPSKPKLLDEQCGGLATLRYSEAGAGRGAVGVAGSSSS